MRGFLASVMGLLLIIGIPASLPAKEKTVRITIKGGDLKTPIQITDPAILANFNVWSGPGTSSTGASSDASRGLIVDWSHGAIPPPPEGLPLYEVFFYANFGEKEEKLVYVVTNGYDPSTRHGYVHLPGRGEKWWQLNVGSIYRRVEGEWFSAWSVWEDVARPVIAKARETAG